MIFDNLFGEKIIRLLLQKNDAELNHIQEALEEIKTLFQAEQVYFFVYDENSRYTNTLFQGLSKNILKEHINNLNDQPWIFELKKGIFTYDERIKSYFIPLLFDEQLISVIELLKPNQDMIEELQENKSFHLIIELFSYVIDRYLTSKENQNEAMRQQIMANISHELKTPLSGLYNAHYLLGTTPLTVEQNEYLELGQASLDALSSIIDDILEINKIEKGNLIIEADTFNLEDELIRIIKMKKAFALEKQIALLFKFDNTIQSELIGDYRKVRQILLHIIDNGIKYTNQGSVTLEARLIKQDSDHLDIQFDILDTGIGINEKDISSIMEQFFQVDYSDIRNYQGMGLGLSISSALISLLGGKMSIESTINLGTQFHVTIPFLKGKDFEYPLANQIDCLILSDKNKKSKIYPILSSMGLKTYTLDDIDHKVVDFIMCEHMEMTEDELKSLKKKHGKKHVSCVNAGTQHMNRMSVFDMVIEFPISRRTLYQHLINRLRQDVFSLDQYQEFLNAYVLIVDDNRLNRIALDNILKKFGIVSKLAESGKQAIEMVKSEHFDMILMDVQMPDMDGFEATRRIRSLGKEEEKIPIIAITANAFLKDYDVMKTSKINDVIFKPIQVEHLSQVLRKYIMKTTISNIPNDLFVFDQKDFEMRFDGSLDIAQEVIFTFFEEYPKDMLNIESAIHHLNPKEINETTHYFKGSCSYLSAQRAVWILTKMMEMSKAEELSQMKAYYLQLDKEIKALVEAIKEYMK